MRVTGQALIGQFGEAYVFAVVRAAGFQISNVMNDSGHKIDWIIAGSGADNTTRDPRLEVQVKTTTSHRLANGCSSFNFDKELYDWARKSAEMLYMPRIVVLVHAPEDPGEWMRQGEHELVIKHCAFWVSLCGDEALEHTQKSRSIQFPSEQKFDVDGLVGLMSKIRVGEPL